MNAPERCPGRQYLHDLPLDLRDARDALRDARETLVGLWPFVWCSTALRDAHNAGSQGFELGRERERYEEERRREAPEVGAALRMPRVAWGLSLAEAAEIVEVDAGQLERIENGEEVAPLGFESRVAIAYGTWAGTSAAERSAGESE